MALFQQTSIKTIQVSFVLRKIKAITIAIEKSLRVKAIVIVKETVGDFITHLRLDRGLDDIQDLLGKSILLELVSKELDPMTVLEKKRIKALAHRMGHEGEDIKYEAKFEIPKEYGEVGAVFVENEHHREMYINEIIIDGFLNGSIKVKCDSWVHSNYEDPQKRVFLANKVQTLSLGVTHNQDRMKRVKHSLYYEEIEFILKFLV